LQNPVDFQAPPGQDAHVALSAVADLIGSDASKFTLVFMDSRPASGDVISLASHVGKTIGQFSAWCSGGQSFGIQTRRGK
jgi:hypothetical protein